MSSEPIVNSVLRDGLRESDSTSLVVYPTLNFNGEVRIEITATDDSGAFVVDTLTLDIHAINDPPVFAQSLVDTSLNEDGTLGHHLWATDDDLDSLSYDVYSDTVAISVSYSDSTVWIVPADNWNGNATLTFLVSDDSITVSDTMHVSVTPVNDAPAPFALLSPGSEEFISHTDSIEQSFAWEPSIDVDGDPVQYSLSFTSQSWDTTIAELDTTLHRLNIEGFPRAVDVQWSVIAFDADTMTSSLDTSIIQVSTIVGVVDWVNLPSEYVLKQNYPNPFNPSTTIQYGLPELSDVSLVIYDIRGREVNSWQAEHQQAGWYELQWHGENSFGKQVATGMYFARLVAGDYSKVIKMAYLR